MADRHPAAGARARLDGDSCTRHPVPNAPTTVDELAAKSGRLDVQTMVTELEAILGSGALAAYRLDTGTRYVERVAAALPAEAGAPISFVCPSCGATNENVPVVGGVAQCAYCEGMVRG